MHKHWSSVIQGFHRFVGASTWWRCRQVTMKGHLSLNWEYVRECGDTSVMWGGGNRGRRGIFASSRGLLFRGVCCWREVQGAIQHCICYTEERFLVYRLWETLTCACWEGDLGDLGKVGIKGAPTKEATEGLARTKIPEIFENYIFRSIDGFLCSRIRFGKIMWRISSFLSFFLSTIEQSYILNPGKISADGLTGMDSLRVLWRK